jgi:hypothetical protein
MNNIDQDNIECTPEETLERVTTCKSCENFFIAEDSNTKCKETGCNISFMTTFNFKSCPKGNW